MSRWWWSAWLALVLPLSACGHAPTEQEKKTVDEMTTGMQAWGVGRHLMDFPATWRYGSGDVTLYYGLGADHKKVDVRVIAEDVSQDSFQAAIRARGARIGAIENIQTGTSMFNFQRELDGNAFLLQFFESTELPDTRTHEIHLLKDGVYVLLTANSYNGMTSQVECRLKELATQIDKVIDPERVGAGFVLGPIIIRGKHDHENGTIYFYDPQRLDVTFEVGISAVTPDEETKLSQRDVDAFGVTRRNFLRERKILLAGMEGEEGLLGYDTKESNADKPYRQLLFAAESYRPNPGFMRPTLSLRLGTGGGKVLQGDGNSPDSMAMEAMPTWARRSSSPGLEAPEQPVNSSLTDYEAMGVWDAILKSVRPRSGAVAPPSEPAPSVYIDPQKVEADRQTLDDFLASGPRSFPRE